MRREECDNKCKREQGRGNVDIFKNTKHGLYSKASPWINASYDNWMFKIDLEQVHTKLMKMV